jgi:hypothetical protein
MTRSAATLGEAALSEATRSAATVGEAALCGATVSEAALGAASLSEAALIGANLSARLRLTRVLALAVVAVPAEWEDTCQATSVGSRRRVGRPVSHYSRRWRSGGETYVTPRPAVAIGREDPCHASTGRQHVRGGSPREGARSAKREAATGGGGPQAPPTRKTYWPHPTRNLTRAPPTRNFTRPATELRLRTMVSTTHD